MSRVYVRASSLPEAAVNGYSGERAAKMKKQSKIYAAAGSPFIFSAV